MPSGDASKGERVTPRKARGLMPSGDASNGERVNALR